MSKLADLAAILDHHAVDITTTELNELADRLFGWALTVSTNLFRPALVAEFSTRQSEFEHWQQLHARVRLDRRHPDYRPPLGDGAAGES